MSTSEQIRQWLLCRCCAYRVDPCSVLYSEENRRAQSNDYATDMSDWSSEGIADTLFLLARNGEIRFWQSSTERRSDLSNISLENALNAYKIDKTLKKSRLFYGFTLEGAKNWEAYYKPNWNYFHDSRLYESGEEYVECKFLLVAGSQEQRYQMLGAWLDYMGCDKSFGLRNIRTGEKCNWQATYWKTLAMGYFARATCRYDDSSSGHPASQYLKNVFVPLEHSLAELKNSAE